MPPHAVTEQQLLCVVLSLLVGHSHNANRHFDSTLKTHQIKFIPSGLKLCAFTEVKMSPFAVSI